MYRAPRAAQVVGRDIKPKLCKSKTVSCLCAYAKCLTLNWLILWPLSLLTYELTSIAIVPDLRYPCVRCRRRGRATLSIIQLQLDGISNWSELASLPLFLFLSLSHSLLPAHVRWRELSGQTASDRRWIASTAAVCRAEFTARTLSHNMLISGPHVRAAFVAWGPNQIAVAAAIRGQTFAMLGWLFGMLVREGTNFTMSEVESFTFRHSFIFNFFRYNFYWLSTDKHLRFKINLIIRWKIL